MLNKAHLRGKIVEKIGVIKEFDKLDRLVIPKELRERFGLYGQIEIVATKDGVLIKNPEYILSKIEDATQGKEGQ